MPRMAGALHAARPDDGPQQPTSLPLGSGSFTGRPSSAEEDCCAWALLLVGREEVLGLEVRVVTFLPVALSFGSHAPSPWQINREHQVEMHTCNRTQKRPKAPVLQLPLTGTSSTPESDCSVGFIH